jgi:hypothetical protein
MGKRAVGNLLAIVPRRREDRIPREWLSTRTVGRRGNDWALSGGNVLHRGAGGLCPGLQRPRALSWPGCWSGPGATLPRETSRPARALVRAPSGLSPSRGRCVCLLGARAVWRGTEHPGPAQGLYPGTASSSPSSAGLSGERQRHEASRRALDQTSIAAQAPRWTQEKGPRSARNEKRARSPKTTRARAGGTR